MSIFFDRQDLEAGVQVEEDVQGVVGVLLLLEGLQVFGLPHPARKDSLETEHRRLPELVSLPAVVVDLSSEEKITLISRVWVRFQMGEEL